MEWLTASSKRDGRLESATNEARVLEKIADKFSIIQQRQARNWWDFSICENGVLLPVNLKLTELGSANDNMNCKLGIYYALTGQEPDFANEISWNNFFERLATDMKENDRDYYFLIVNKNNTSDVLVQGLKTLHSLVPNGNNLPFQCCWRNNREPESRSFSQACDFWLSHIARSIKLRAEIDCEFKEHFPEYWEKVRVKC